MLCGILYLVQFLHGRLVNRYWINYVFYKKQKNIFFVSIFSYQSFLATYIPLINDEAYAIAVLKQFSLSFFDHPPLGFLSSQIFPKIFGFENEVLYRLPFLLYGFATSIVLYEIGKAIKTIM